MLPIATIRSRIRLDYAERSATGRPHRTDLGERRLLGSRRVEPAVEDRTLLDVGLVSFSPAMTRAIPVTRH